MGGTHANGSGHFVRTNLGYVTTKYTNIEAIETEH